jgi:hypothetical protein
VYVIITLETAALDTHKKVTVLVTDAAAKRAPTFCPLYIKGMIKVTNNTTPNISHKYLQNVGKNFKTRHTCM